MNRDPIVEEVRAIRREIEAACQHDWDKLFDHFAQVEKTSGRLLVNRPFVQATESERIGPSTPADEG